MGDRCNSGLRASTTDVLAATIAPGGRASSLTMRSAFATAHNILGAPWRSGGGASPRCRRRMNIKVAVAAIATTGLFVLAGCSMAAAAVAAAIPRRSWSAPSTRSAARPPSPRRRRRLKPSSTSSTRPAAWTVGRSSTRPSTTRATRRRRRGTPANSSGATGGRARRLGEPHRVRDQREVLRAGGHPLDAGHRRRHRMLPKREHLAGERRTLVQRHDPHLVRLGGARPR